MKESDLYQPVRDWLVSKGYEVYVEKFDADIVAMKDGKITVVELKPCLTHKLIAQCHNRSQWADFVFMAVASTPRTIGGPKYYGYGVLQVTGGKVRQRAMARPQPWQWHKKRNYRLKKLASQNPAMDHEVAGLPSGPQLREQRQHALRLAQSEDAA